AALQGVGAPSPRKQTPRPLSQEERRRREAALEEVSRMAAEQQERSAEERRALFRRRCQTYDATLALEPIREQEGGACEQQCGAVVVFDWDDTLLPTTWLSNNVANVEDD
ncbi:unnamed protein product, partial [Prorocentrum cordatum]